MTREWLDGYGRPYDFGSYYRNWRYAVISKSQYLQCWKPWMCWPWKRERTGKELDELIEEGEKYLQTATCDQMRRIIERVKANRKP